VPQLVGGIGEAGQQAVFAILEVLVEGRARDTGALDDVLDRGSLVAALGDDLAIATSTRSRGSRESCSA
jgi:hypothetical protein